MKKLYFLGICGTFMGGLAVLARQMGYTVSGVDNNAYPPMTDYLQSQGIAITSGYDAKHLNDAPDLVIVGNSLVRGNGELEYVLDNKIPFTSGPQWLADNILKNKTVLTVTGTHGKTTVASMLTWILETADLAPSFLIGGIAENMQTSARLTDSPYFVIEGDEYDTAFFDKRSKFIHYHPDIAIINNVEFDHADIFPDIAAIERQFHHMIRTMPAKACIIAETDNDNIDHILAKGCWSQLERFGAVGDWSYTSLVPDASQFEIVHRGKPVASVSWPLYGQFNAMNALAAVAAAAKVGVTPEVAAKALNRFQGVKCRLQLLSDQDKILVLQDFAHHPTAIAVTLQALKSRFPQKRLIAVVELRSNSMKIGVHQKTLQHTLHQADMAYVFEPDGLDWSLAPKEGSNGIAVFHNTNELLTRLVDVATAGDVFVVMSNGAFDGIPGRLQAALTA